MWQSEEIHNELILLYHEDSKVYIAIKDDFLPMIGIDLKKNPKTAVVSPPEFDVLLGMLCIIYFSILIISLYHFITLI